MHALSKVYLVAASLVFANSLTFATSPIHNGVRLTLRGPASPLQLTRGISASGLKPQTRLIRTWTLLKPLVRQAAIRKAQSIQCLFLCPAPGDSFGDRESPLTETSKSTPGADFEVITARLESLKHLALQQKSQRSGKETERKRVFETPMRCQEFAALNQTMSRNLFSEPPTQ